MRVLFDHVNAYLRKIEEELPSEHAKKRECTDAIQSIQLEDSHWNESKTSCCRPLKGSFGATKLWDAFVFVKNEHSDGNMGGMGKDFFNGMKHGQRKHGCT